MRLQPIVTACLLAGLTSLLYGFRLTAAPVTPEEAAFNNSARDVDVGATPLFFHVRDDEWQMPVPVYAIASAQATGGGDFSGRIASVMAAAIDAGLMFLCARVVMGRDLAAAIAAFLLIFMPAHLALGRSGSAAIFPLPFALLAMWNVAAYLKDARTLRLLGAGLTLGVGVYTHPTAPLTMAFLAALFIFILAIHRQSWGIALPIAGAFALCLVPAGIWFALHPETYQDTFGRWAIHQAHIRYPLDGIRALVNWNTLGTRASLYWSFFDPAWLFFDDAASVAPLLLFMVPPVVWGVAKGRAAVFGSTFGLIAGGVVVAPLAGSSFGVAHSIENAAAFLPFVALLCGTGIAAVVGKLERRIRIIVTIVAVGVIVEFSRAYFRAVF